MAQRTSKYQIIIDILSQGGVGVLPTDTLYGIVGSAFSPETVEKIYTLRKRNKKKPMIVLIGNIKDLELFNISLTVQIKKILKQVWPGKVSVILPLARRAAVSKQFEYLHRGTKQIAFRLPASPENKKDFDARDFLKHTGPLVAPSANFEGEPPAKTIQAAKEYFGDNVDFYLDVGELDSAPSTIIKIEKGNAIVLREGAVGVNKKLTK
jgi:L-threonylcarbamoyladenylate synthase